MLQIRLIPDEHDHDVRISVITELLEPSGHIYVGAVLCDVVYEKGTNCSSVVTVGRGGSEQQKFPGGGVPRCKVDRARVIKVNHPSA